MTNGATPNTGTVKTIVASAGTGKTHNVVQTIAETIENGTAPEKILATTFTVKAADELIERARARLVAAGRPTEATRLLAAKMGTVNSVSGRLAGEHAIDLGRSPAVDVIAEEELGRIFAIAADEAIARHALRLNALAIIFGFDQGRANDRIDWRRVVRDLIELARANGISAGELHDSAERSVSSFLDLLSTPEAGENPNDFDENLSTAIKALLADLPSGDIGNDAKNAIRDSQTAQDLLSRGEQVPWHMWAKLSKVKAAKKAGQVVQQRISAIAAAASVHIRHPRLRGDSESLIRSIFSCAADALEAYQSFKEERGLVDFVDQEAIALEILNRPDLVGQLKEGIEQVFVDEFQDSSPLQIAIFTTLSSLADLSTWVGDPKQSIYGFRDADSTLTLAAARGAAASSGIETQILSESWRSRRGIIEFTNDAFNTVFDAMGLPEAENSFTGTHRDDTDTPEPPLSVWLVSSKKLDDRALEVAAGVQNALGSAEEWLVEKDGVVHPLRSGDIAVLCRSSDRVSRIAEALSTLGIKVAVERAALLQTPEAELVYAALRWTTDPTDRLALAEILRLLGGADDPGLWLQAVLADDQGQALEDAVPFASELKSLRDRQLSLTPSDVIDAITGTSGVRAYIDRLGNSALRLDNLETLRGLARTYESECANLALPATAGGLVLWLANQTPLQPRSLDPDAVKVMTYHGAKGLEWPMVVLTDLEEPLKDKPFGLAAEISDEIDWRDPLANRWVRYWPWPYGAQRTNVGLDALAGASDTGLKTTQRTRDEEIRLLYVGMTRARDHLVLVNPTLSGTAKLDLLTNAEGVPHVELPVSLSSGIQIGPNSHPARVIDLSTLAPEPHDSVEVTHASIKRASVDRPPLFIRPSETGAEGVYRVADVVDLGPRVPITGNPDMTALGEAVHAIFASDRPSKSAEERVTKAQDILDRWRVSEVVASDLITAVDQFLAHLAATYPGATIRKEVPVFARVGEQIVSGRIDVLVESDDWFAIFDHKSFPGNRAKREAAAIEYTPQLKLYADSVQIALKRECRGLFIHMPISGALLELTHRDIRENGSCGVSDARHARIKS